jgi:hypothetical protein
LIGSYHLILTLKVSILDLLLLTKKNVAHESSRRSFSADGGAISTNESIGCVRFVVIREDSWVKILGFWYSHSDSSI